MGPFNVFKRKEEPEINIQQETEQLLSRNASLSREEALHIAALRSARVWRRNTMARMHVENPDLSTEELLTLLAQTTTERRAGSVQRKQDQTKVMPR